MEFVRAGMPLTASVCCRWARKPVNTPPTGPVDATVDHYRVEVQVPPGLDAVAAFERLRARVFAYGIFPPRRFRAYICPAGPITDGATIVQRLVVGPLALEMAVRVIAVWDRHDGDTREAGFRYATLAGHAEQGVEDFIIRLDGDGRLLVVLEARSRPGTWLTNLGRPVARLVQRRMTQAALRRLSQPSLGGEAITSAAS